MFEDSPEIIINLSEAKDSKSNKWVEKESTSIIKMDQIEIDYSDESILTESVCSLKVRREGLHSLIICKIHNLIREEGEDNWMFRALSRTTFGSSEYHSDIRVQVEKRDK